MTSENTTPAADLGLFDLGSLDLDDIDRLPDSVLGNAVRQVLANRSGLPDRFAAFQNSL